MRGMILAAGLGTRLRPLTQLRAKPALPVRGLPLLAYGLALLHHHGVREVAINLHHLPETGREAALRYRPPDTRLELSHEPEPLGTGGGIRRVAPFLRESDPSLVLAGDMILDADLDGFVRRHRERRAFVTLLLRDDPRAASFGSVGVDEEGRVRRIGTRLDLGGESACGIYAHATAISARSLETLPPGPVSNHLDDWLIPRLAAGARDVFAEVLPRDAGCWVPVGTPREYLEANLTPLDLSYLDADTRAREEGTRLEPKLVIGAGASLGPGAHLERAVVWDRERVPAGLRAREGVFAGGRFHPCPPPSRGGSAHHG